MGDFGTVEAFDNFAALRNKIRELAEKTGEYAGVPMPLEGEDLVIHPTYKFASALGKAKPAKPESDDGWRLRNRFWSDRKRGDIVIMQKGDRIEWGLDPGIHHIGYDLKTLGCSDAWGIEQESKALQLLGQHVRHRAFKHYLLTGMFLETSKRSGVTYVFRKLRPTVATKPGRDGEMRILACLCMHPIAHYAGSWAGAMCPTDDVIAHLMLMRADEAMYWRRCNQHAPYRPEAGL